MEICDFVWQIQSFAGRLARARELKTASLPSWWKPDVHDAHLLIASCIYGKLVDSVYLVVSFAETLRPLDKSVGYARWTHGLDSSVRSLLWIRPLGPFFLFVRWIHFLDSSVGSFF